MIHGAVFHSDGGALVLCNLCERDRRSGGAAGHLTVWEPLRVPAECSDCGEPVSGTADIPFGVDPRLADPADVFQEALRVRP